MYEIGDYVYIFFREVAIEYINCGKASNFYNFISYCDHKSMSQFPSAETNFYLTTTS